MNKISDKCENALLTKYNTQILANDVKIIPLAVLIPWIYFVFSFFIV